VQPSTTVARSVDELRRLAPAWDALADDVGAPLFSRPFWCIPWATHMRAGRPEVVVLTEGDELMGIAPVSVRSIGGIELVRFLGHGLGAVSSFITRPDDGTARERLWDSVLGGRRRFAQLLELRASDEPGTIAHGWPNDVAAHDSCLVVSCGTSFDAYLAARSKKLRENLRRAERSLPPGRTHRVELITTESRWLEVRGEVMQVFDAAETAQPRQHLLRGALAPFTDDLLATSAAAGRLRLLVGRVDDAPASFGVAFAAGTTLSYWITRFDPTYAAASVGVLMLREIVALGFREGFDRVDLLLGDQAHKRRWSTDSYDTLRVLAASNPALLLTGRAALSAAASVRALQARAARRG
jgi:CelD/BcsL family acetyltransferase involved in cellulose biosynthesis